MIKSKVIVAAGALAFLSACSVTQDLQSLQGAERTGSAFNQALADEYQTFAEFEANEMLDWIDQAHFAHKGLMAARGQDVQPEELADWDLPESAMGDLTAARAELIRRLNDNGRTNHPMEAAHAQAKFDCWVEQQEENHQPEDIAACRTDFEAALAALVDVMEPAPAAAPPPPPPARAGASNYLVFFDFDSSAITPEADRILTLVAARSQTYEGGAAVTIVGHTDTSGPVDYNRALGMRRAQAVIDRLEALGIEESSVSILSLGESEPLVPTEDGVREPQNRRATIQLR